MFINQVCGRWVNGARGPTVCLGSCSIITLLTTIASIYALFFCISTIINIFLIFESYLIQFMLCHVFLLYDIRCVRYFSINLSQTFIPTICRPIHTLTPSYTHHTTFHPSNQVICPYFHQYILPHSSIPLSDLSTK